MVLVVNPWLKQTYIIFLAKLKKPHFAPGPESSECQLFSLDDIPFDSLAFSSFFFFTLNLFVSLLMLACRAGSSPSDMHAFSLVIIYNPDM
ncbi:hypothetical protein Patl1_32767 [Pistacia atlantica]|uniref:Uncharacterized protein n=1 Tax=Pistacia atlantica TaxID=434234 RepID=A0ACC1AQZ5_9ROSI|nr:hypothetical protein Patl1_32767 [Pistacia atlantica]